MERCDQNLVCQSDKNKSMANSNLIDKTNRVVTNTIRKTSCSRGWLKQLNQVLFGTITVVVFVLLMMVVLHEAMSNNTDEDSCESCERCIVTGCHVMCTNTGLASNVDDEIARQIMQADQDCNGEGILLDLHNPQFPHGRIPFAWLSGYNVNIIGLEISGGNLHSLPPAAFLSISFVNLRTLIFTGVAIRRIQGESFFGLTRLTNLHIRSSTISHAERNSLGPVADTLEVLQIKESSSFDLQNITGGVSMLLNLELVDLTFNDFSDKLNRNTFLRLKCCKYLYLSSSKITSIGEGTFDHLDYIDTIKLDNNYLTTLHPRIFNHIIAVVPNFKLNLQNNPWHCDCNLENLRLMYHQNYLIGDPMCTSPIDYKNSLLSRLDTLCSYDTLTTTEIPETNTRDNGVNETITLPTSVEESTELTPRNGIYYYNTLCDEPGANRNLTVMCNGDSVSFEDWLIHVLTKNSVDDEFSLLMRKAAIVLWNGLRTGLDNIYGHEYSVVWFKSLCPTEGFCLRTNIVNSFDLAVSGEVYVYCLVENKVKIIRATNCITYVATSIESFQNTGRVSILTPASMTTIFALSIVGCMFASACVVYVTVRKNPSLLRGSKRVLLVRHRVADALILPPKFPERCKVERRESKISAISGTPSYISALQPTEDQLAIWRLSQHFDPNLSMMSYNGQENSINIIEDKSQYLIEDEICVALDKGNHI